MAVYHWLTLAMTEGIGPILAGRIIAATGSAQAACTADIALLKTIEGIGSAKASRIYAALKEAKNTAEHELARADSMNVTIIGRDDEQYPILLKSIPDPPLVLYMIGNLEPRDLNGIALVGSRKCSMYGREQADRFAATLAGVGFTVISGGARGIDTSAHRGALSHRSGRTIAVIGSGLDRPYPAENAPLFDQIAQRGAVLSEYPFGTAPLAENFPRRNRIVSGMSRGVLVIEADERSGALITARQAIEDHNRPVFAIPGRVDNPLSAGPHKLIREGAVLTSNIQDILDGLGSLPQSLPVPENDEDASMQFQITEQPSPPIPSNVVLTDNQLRIINALAQDECDVDTITDRSGLPVHTVMQELTFLSLKGQLKRSGDQRYARRI